MFQNTHYSLNFHGNQPNPSLQDKKHFFLGKIFKLCNYINQKHVQSLLLFCKIKTYFQAIFNVRFSYFSIYIFPCNLKKNGSFSHRIKKVWIKKTNPLQIPHCFVFILWLIKNVKITQKIWNHKFTSIKNLCTKLH